MQPPSGGLFTIATITLASLLASPSVASAACSASAATGGDASAPCFSNVDDILGGERYLLANDDLLLSYFDLASDNTSTFKNLPFYTDLLKPDEQSEQKVGENTKCKSTPPGPARANVRLGRIYNLKTDVVVTSIWTIPPGTATCSQTFFVTNPEGSLLHEIGNAIQPEPRLVLLDADLDGFDDIFMINAANMTFHSPADVNDTGSDMRFVSRYPTGDGSLPPDLTPRGEPVTGDFNGDRAMDIAWLGAADAGDVNIHFLSVCPAEGWEIVGTRCSQAFEIVPWRETIETDQTWTQTNGSHAGHRFEKTYPRMGIAAGDFWGDRDAETGLPTDELVLIRLAPATQGAYAYEFQDGEWNQRASTPLGDTGFPVGVSDSYPVGSPPFVTSGRLDWGDSNEQVVAAWSAYPWWGVWVLSFDDEQQFILRAYAPSDNDTYTRIRGLAIGRFDPPDLQFQPLDPPGQPATPELDFDQQIAVLFTEEAASDGADPKTLIDIFTAGPPFFQPTPVESARTVFFDSIPFLDDLPLSAPLQAGDLQGRSLRLGAPEKVTVVHSQPDIVLGMPPMHADFIAPAGIGEQQVYNVSVAPDVFKLAYTDSTKRNVKQTRKSTTSYTYAKTNTFNEQISYGIPNVFGVSVSAKQSAKNTHKTSVANHYSSYSGDSTTLSTTTVFDDQILYTQQRMNVYTYPVIGENICPLESPNCPLDCGTGPSPCPQSPLAVQFSGADNVVHVKPSAAHTLEWYQPVQERGNLFSYPTNLQQLEANQPQGATSGTSRLQLLASGGAGNDVWHAEAGNTTESVKWSSGTTSAQTAGSTSNHSFDSSVTVSGNLTIGGFGLSGGATFDRNKSRSLSTLNGLTITLSESDGVTLTNNLEGGTVSTLKDYLYGSYIFGLQAPVGTIQDDLNLDTDVAAQGAMTVASIADPLGGADQNWWINSYKVAPDVALNHPNRWNQSTPQGSNDQVVWFNCPIGYTSSPTPATNACSPATPPSPLPVAIATSDFYQIKGFFVQPGLATGFSSVGTGPSTNSATFGDKVQLGVRIYNYSFAQMPVGSEVHAAFYAQPWLSGQFAAEPGNPDVFAPAVFIDEAVVDRISPFCGGLGGGGQDTCADAVASQRNWVLAQVELDTTKLGAPPPDEVTYWKFWVVTWIEDESGIVAEMPMHGLKESDFRFLIGEFNSLADVPIEIYSNNLGFYNQTFTLLSAPSDALAAEAEATDVALEPELQISEVHVENTQGRGDAVVVRATLRSNVPLHDVTVHFFEGDPTEDDAPFDAETIAYIAADEPFVVPVRYRSSGCQASRVHVEAFSMSDDVEPARAKTRHRIRPDVNCRGKHFGKRGDNKHFAGRDHFDR